MLREALREEQPSPTNGRKLSTVMPGVRILVLFGCTDKQAPYQDLRSEMLLVRSLRR